MSARPVIHIGLEFVRGFGGMHLFVRINSGERRSIAGSKATENGVTYGDIAARVRGDLRGPLAHLDVTPLHFTYIHQGVSIESPQPLMHETPLHHRLRRDALRTDTAPEPAPDGIGAARTRAHQPTEEKKLTKKERWAARQQTVPSVAKKSGDDGKRDAVTAPAIVTAAMTRTASECEIEVAAARRDGTFWLMDETGVETGCGAESIDLIKLPIRPDLKDESPLRCAVPGCSSLVLFFKVRNPRETEFAVEERERGRSYYRAHHTHCLADASHNYCVIRSCVETRGLAPLSYKCAWSHDPAVAERIAVSVPSTFPQLSGVHSLAAATV